MGNVLDVELVMVCLQSYHYFQMKETASISRVKRTFASVSHPTPFKKSVSLQTLDFDKFYTTALQLRQIQRFTAFKREQSSQFDDFKSFFN
jgi:hypothetical protein